MAKSKQEVALQAELSEGRARLKAMDQERRKRVSNYAYWMLQGVLLNASAAGFARHELDAIAYRAGELCHRIERGFPRKAAEVPHG